MSSDEEEASHVIVVKGIHRLGERLFLEVGMSTTGSLPLTRGECSADPAVYPLDLSELLARPDSPITEADREESGPGASVSTE